MKVILFFPRVQDLGGEEVPPFPLGLAYISSTLKKHGHEVRCVNLSLEQGPVPELVENHIRDFDPDICGTGAVSVKIALVQELFRLARSVKPSLVTIVGNSVFSVDPANTLGIIGADIGVVGEGEGAIVEILDALEHGRPLDPIEGIAFRRDGATVVTKPRKQRHDIDALPWPDYESFGLEKFFALQRGALSEVYCDDLSPRHIVMITSRSCAYSCTFCFHPLGSLRKERSLDDVFRELDHLIERFGVKSLGIYDELFAANRERVLEFCRRIRPYGITFEIQLHTSLADAEILDSLRSAGCVLISYGVESGSDAVLESMHKRVAFTQIANALRLTYEARIINQGLFIFGDSAETVDTANETLRWWAANRHLGINLSNLMVYPGTRIYSEAVKKGFLKKEEGLSNPLQYIFLNITGMSSTTMNLLRQKSWALGATINSLAPVLRHERMGVAEPAHADLYSLFWKCPRCGGESTVHGARLGLQQGSVIHSVRTACIHCHTRFVLKNPMAIQIRSAGVDAAFDQALALRRQGDLNQAFRILAEIYRQAPWHAGAFQQLGEIHVDRGDLVAGLSLLSQSLQKNPFNYDNLMVYAAALEKEGALGAAKLYYDYICEVMPGYAPVAIDARLNAQKLVENNEPARLDKFIVDHPDPIAAAA